MIRSKGYLTAIAGCAAIATWLLATEARAQTSDSVKIGFLTDLSGAAADFSGKGTILSARLAIEDFGGKVLGRPIELLEADHLNKPDTGLAIARRWYDENVNAIFDIGVTNIAIGVQQLAREKNRIVIPISTGSADITGKFCSPNGIHWTYDTYAEARGAFLGNNTGGAKDSWYFLTVSYAYGANIERDITEMIKNSGGTVLGGTKHPFETTDFSSELLQAQSSRASVFGLATTTMHAAMVIRQAEEFGFRKGGQRIAAPTLTLHDVKALGLKLAQDIIVVETFYWDQNDATRAFAKRYFDRFGKMPNMNQASSYGAVMHYLKAVEAVQSTDADKVLARMKATPINDFMTKDGSIRVDGRVIRDVYLFRVKKPEESKGEWDLYEQIRTIPGAEAFRAPDPAACNLVK
jgi:branched-chain amino acid transport system substrate-binding protein